ncbi:hypothetical protein [Colwellia sp. RSH04]|uniref:hypothetical protein n=1 Tax=Colwellia sp. RSH04 TaxID=2305464 RepID=UPI0011C21D5B|nr:hypothetical protein [Colwellia sp. RSH04]
MHQKTTNHNSSNYSLMRWGAVTYFSMPLCYIGMFLVFGIFLTFPQSDHVVDKVSYIVSQQSLLSLGYIIGYLLFGSLLLVSVQATHSRLKAESHHLLNVASAFGLIWVVLMMCSGMIALVGMNTMVKLFLQGSPHAEMLFVAYSTVVDSLGGGIEFVGGMWVFILSLYGLKTLQIAKPLSFFGLLVGLLGICTLMQTIPGIKEAFGLCQIIWFICMGFFLLKNNVQN